MQTWNLPLESNQSLSSSRTDINDGFDSLRTHFLGTADPGTLVDGMVWVNTTSNKLKHRAGGSTFDIGDWGVSNLGHLRKDGTIALTANWNVGSFKITNLAAGSAASSDAARILDVETRLAKAGGQLDSAALLQYQGAITLTDNLHLTHKAYCDAKVLKAGDTGISGRLAYSTTFGSSVNADILRKDEITTMDFNTATGHEHDGTDSRKVLATSLNIGAATDRQVLGVTSGVPAFQKAVQVNDDESASLFSATVFNSSATSVDVSSLTPSGASAAILWLKVALVASAGGSIISFDFELSPDSGVFIPYRFYTKSSGVGDAPEVTITGQYFVQLSSSRRFSYRTIDQGSSGTYSFSVEGRLIGYV